MDMFALTVPSPFLAVACSQITVSAPPTKNLQIETASEPESTSEGRYGKQVTQDEVRSLVNGWVGERRLLLQTLNP